jgi:predicted nucleotidyltransferase
MDKSVISEANKIRPEVPGTYLFRTIVGSQAYGTDTPASDIDVSGIFVPSVEYHLGFNKNVEQIKQGKDTTIYSLKKFMHLAATNNPNVLELLFVPEDCILEVHPLFQKILDNRKLFLSKNVRYRYCGYAYGQIKRINTHRRWLLHPLKKEPSREDFGLPLSQSLVSREQMNAFYITLAHMLRDIASMADLYDHIVEIIESDDFPGWEGVVQSRGIPEEAYPAVQKLTDASDNFIEALRREQAYYRNVDEWSKYQDWLKTRNPKRSELEKKFGFDTKHASHVVRLMLQGEEIMTTGNLSVRHKDCEKIKGVKFGKWLDGSDITYEKVKDFAAEYEEKMKELYKSDRCVLPNKPAINELDDMCVDITMKTCGLAKSFIDIQPHNWK